jgi:hypothetical protein
MIIDRKVNHELLDDNIVLDSQKSMSLFQILNSNNGICINNNSLYSSKTALYWLRYPMKYDIIIDEVLNEFVNNCKALKKKHELFDDQTV